MELSQRAPPIIGLAAITLGIGPYCSFVFILCYNTFVLIGECVLLLCWVLFLYTKPRDWLGERVLSDLCCDEWDVKP